MVISPNLRLRSIRSRLHVLLPLSELYDSEFVTPKEHKKNTFRKTNMTMENQTIWRCMSYQKWLFFNCHVEFSERYLADSKPPNERGKLFPKDTILCSKLAKFPPRLISWDLITQKKKEKTWKDYKIMTPNHQEIQIIKKHISTNNMFFFYQVRCLYLQWVKKILPIWCPEASGWVRGDLQERWGFCTFHGEPFSMMIFFLTRMEFGDDFGLGG